MISRIISILSIWIFAHPNRQNTTPCLIPIQPPHRLQQPRLPVNNYLFFKSKEARECVRRQERARENLEPPPNQQESCIIQMNNHPCARAWFLKNKASLNTDLVIAKNMHDRLGCVGPIFRISSKENPMQGSGLRCAAKIISDTESSGV